MTQANERISWRDGMGSFLYPPTHPMHKAHVELDIRRKPENRGGMSLDTAAECDYINEGVRNAAKAILDAWTAPPAADYAVVLWRKRVMAHFQFCYRGRGDEPDCWFAGNIVIDRMVSPLDNADQHAGVRWVRKFYPDFALTLPDLDPNCRDCDHHVNAHDNGSGGRCGVIIDRDAYESARDGTARLAALCKCTAFTYFGQVAA